MARRLRVHLGTRTGLSFVHKVYRTPDAIEVDEIEGVDVTRRRVLLEEVLLVTYHRAYGLAFVLTLVALALVFSGLSALVALGDRATALVVFALTGLPTLVLLALRLALGIDVLTIHGARTRAQVHFWLRKGRGREVFRQVCRLARERQEQLARQLARAQRAATAFPQPPAAGAGPTGEPAG
jgi:hypothetical protein